MKLVDTLMLTPRGRAWANVLPDDCRDALCYIDSKLDTGWNSSSCFPEKKKVLLPFHMIAPEEVALVVICKEPYASSSMATGVPVETNGKLDTLSSNVFMSLISKYWSSVDKTNFMRCYYASGILVINASFTVGPTHDKRYSLAQSHFPLWTRFCHPLVRYLNSRNIPILGLGTEAKSLLRNSPNGGIVYSCPFPIDGRSISAFTEVAKNLIDNVVFNVDEPMSRIS